MILILILIIHLFKNMDNAIRFFQKNKDFLNAYPIINVIMFFFYFNFFAYSFKIVFFLNLLFL